MVDLSVRVILVLFQRYQQLQLQISIEAHTFSSLKIQFDFAMRFVIGSFDAEGRIPTRSLTLGPFDSPFRSVPLLRPERQRHGRNSSHSSRGPDSSGGAPSICLMESANCGYVSLGFLLLLPSIQSLTASADRGAGASSWSRSR